MLEDLAHFFSIEKKAEIPKIYLGDIFRFFLGQIKYFPFSFWKLRQVVNAHLFRHSNFILLILPVVLQCASNPVLLEIINLGSEEKGKVHKKINTHTAMYPTKWIASRNKQNLHTMKLNSQKFQFREKHFHFIYTGPKIKCLYHFIILFHWFVRLRMPPLFVVSNSCP